MSIYGAHTAVAPESALQQNQFRLYAIAVAGFAPVGALQMAVYHAHPQTVSDSEFTLVC
jgi:hypothetical protein